MPPPITTTRACEGNPSAMASSSPETTGSGRDRVRARAAEVAAATGADDDYAGQDREATQGLLRRWPASEKAEGPGHGHDRTQREDDREQAHVEPAERQVVDPSADHDVHGGGRDEERPGAHRRPHE